MPRVSILLTCYNHIAYLPEAWRSIQSQTFRDFEVIAIDDGSTDGTRDWLRENAHDAILVFNDDNLGTYGSLNRALEEAKGEFVAVFNDDDLWAPEKLAEQIALFEKFPEMGLVHTNGHFIDGKSQRFEGEPLGFSFPRTQNGDIAIALIYANKIIASAVLAKTALLRELGGFDPAYFGSGDWHRWMRVALKAPVGYVDKPLTSYRVHGENASHKLERIWRDDQRLREWLRTMSSELQSHAESIEAWHRAEAHNEACLGTVYKLNGFSKAARQAYAKSMKLQPKRWKTYLRWIATFLPKSWFRAMK